MEEILHRQQKPVHDSNSAAFAPRLPQVNVEVARVVQDFRHSTLSFRAPTGGPILEREREGMRGKMVKVVQDVFHPQYPT